MLVPLPGRAPPGPQQDNRCRVERHALAAQMRPASFSTRYANASARHSRAYLVSLPKAADIERGVLFPLLAKLVRASTKEEKTKFVLGGEGKIYPFLLQV
jgi:hypothetical protein